ncbi:HAD family hydrolase [bacterium]|nr:MAG: HAD family hydrolase [bacterium]
MYSERLQSAVLFDLDGTLTDPKPGITGCISYALEKLGHPSLPPDDLVWCIGPPLAMSFPTLLGSDDPELVTRAIGHYRERFTDIGLYENEVYDGVPEMLATLQEGGYRLFVATSKPLPYAVRILDHFGLGHHFEAVFGSGFDGSLSDKGDLLAHALRKSDLDPAHAIMVGDRMHDVSGARRAGLDCLGVLYGYGGESELREAGAVALCAAPADVTRRVTSRRSSRFPG